MSDEQHKYRVSVHLDMEVGEEMATGRLDEIGRELAAIVLGHGARLVGPAGTFSTDHESNADLLASRCTCGGAGRCLWCLMDRWRARADVAENKLIAIRAAAKVIHDLQKAQTRAQEARIELNRCETVAYGLVQELQSVEPR